MALVLRSHVFNVEVQDTTVALAARNGRPIVATVAHVGHRAVGELAKTRSREIYDGIRRRYLVVEVPPVVPITAYIH